MHTRFLSLGRIPVGHEVVELHKTQHTNDTEHPSRINESFPNELIMKKLGMLQAQAMCLYPTCTTVHPNRVVVKRVPK